MAGLYIHIPFCRQACRYCDFFFTVSLKYREEYVAALLQELEQRKDYLSGEEVQTIYIGGGTPSVLEEEHVGRIMESISKNYKLVSNAELSLEANPDDLNAQYLEMLRRAGFNRLSVGVQSFREEDLTLMRRSHNAQQARACLEAANAKGFMNISMDLIYGIPGLSMNAWEENLRQAMTLPIQHISAYHLTYEPGTVFHHWKKKGKIAEMPEQESVDQYMKLKEISGEFHFEHYEISNFALEGFRSRHNSSYWRGDNYIGFGPSAHSYRGEERRWNISDLRKYMEALQEGKKYHEKEVLNVKDRYHDYLLTSLRTIEGADTDFISREFGSLIVQRLKRKVHEYIGAGDMFYAGSILKMTDSGWLRSDHILSELMEGEDFIFPGQQL